MSELAAVWEDTLEVLRRGAIGLGGVVVAQGPPGSGRSTVLGRIDRAATDLGVRVVGVRGRWPDREIPYAVLRDLLRQVTPGAGLPRSVSRVLAALGIGDVTHGEADVAAAASATLLALEIISQRQPLAVLVDDLQWVDDASVTVLAHTSRRAGDLGCVFAFAVAAPIAADSVAATIEGEADVAIALSPRTTVSREDAMRLRRRLGDASPTARRVALALTALEGHVDPAAVAEATGVTFTAALDALTELQDLALLDQPLELSRAVATSLRADASTELLRISVNAAMVMARRGETDIAANLLLPLPPIDEPWAAETLMRAGDSAVRASEHARACILLERARHERHAPAEIVHLSLAESLVRSGSLADALDALQAAAAAGAPPTQCVEAACELATAAVHAERPDLVTAGLDAARRWATDRESHVLLTATAHAASALAPVEPATPTVDITALTGSTPAERHALAIGAFIAAQRGDSLSDAADLASRAAAGLRLARECWPDPTPAYFAIDVLVDAEHFDMAMALLDELVSEAQRRGATTAFHRHSSIRAYARMLMGDVQGAEADARLALTHDVSPVDSALAAGALVDALIERGELDEAEAIADEHLERPSDSPARSMLLLAAARLDLERGRPATARERTATIENIERREGRRGVPVLWRSIAALADPPNGARLAREEITIARRTGHLRGLVTGLLSLATVTTGAERAVALEQAHETALTAQSPVMRARALLAYGAERRRTNRPTDARPHLHEAASIASGCGATALARAAITELRAAGGKPRRVHTTGPESLTPMEQRVAQEARTGRSNAEIAAGLFITRKTVEMHLSRVYRKLDISSRTQLQHVDLA